MRGLVQVIFGVIVGVVGLVWATLAKGALAEPSARYLGEFADSAPIALVAAGGLYVVTGLLTMVVSGVANVFASGANKKSAARQMDLFHELLTGATVRMVGADGMIAQPELSMVAGVLEKFGQSTVPEKTIRSISESFVKDPDRYLTMMKDRSESLSDDQKTHILRACLLVAMSDVEMGAAEIDYLTRVAQSLKISADRLTKIRDELTNVTQKLVSAAAFAA